MKIKRHIPNNKAREFETDVKDFIEDGKLDFKCITWIEVGEKNTSFILEISNEEEINLINQIEEWL
jgi:hypothetical protein